MKPSVVSSGKLGQFAEHSSMKDQIRDRGRSNEGLKRLICCATLDKIQNRKTAIWDDRKLARRPSWVFIWNHDGCTIHGRGIDIKYTVLIAWQAPSLLASGPAQSNSLLEKILFKATKSEAFFCLRFVEEETPFSWVTFRGLRQSPELRLSTNYYSAHTTPEIERM